jgi:hypothetical protein
VNRRGWAGYCELQKTGAGRQRYPTMNRDTAGSKVVGRLILEIIKRVSLGPKLDLAK